jgi:hypothetical protein
MQSREELAERLLTLTKLGELKERAKHDREWGRVYHGFRPDHLTRPEFQRGAPEFARHLPLLESLCNAFLDGLGVEKDPKLATRLAGASGTDLTTAAEGSAALLQELTATELAALPAHAPEAAAPPANAAGADALAQQA